MLTQGTCQYKLENDQKEQVKRGMKGGIREMRNVYNFLFGNHKGGGGRM